MKTLIMIFVILLLITAIIDMYFGLTNAANNNIIMALLSLVIYNQTNILDRLNKKDI